MSMTAPEILEGYIRALAVSDQLGEELSESTIQDYISQIREELRPGEANTDLPPNYIRHLESRSVCMYIKYLEFSGWIGWTYYYGGGKHTYPENIDWVKDAYFLNCHEERVVVTKRTWTKR